MTGKSIAEPPDPFRFGWRYVRKAAGNGSSEYVRVPLTLDDVLHPLKGDHIPQSTRHKRDVHYLANTLESRLAHRPHVVVFADCLMNWGVKGVRDHSPDIVVFDGVADPERNWTTFHVAEENARCLLALEVVSPDAYETQARDNDVVAKVKEYHKVGVPCYMIVDQEEEDGPRHLVGYRRGTKNYEPMTPDERGRLRLESVGLFIGLRDDRVICWDDRTVEEIEDFTSVCRARRKAEEELAAVIQARQRVEKELAAARARIAGLEKRERTRQAKRRRKK